MDKEFYYVIKQDEDGFSIQRFTLEHLKKTLQIPPGEEYNELGVKEWIEFPSGNYLGSQEYIGEYKAILIKGQVVIPKPKQTVVEWDI